MKIKILLITPIVLLFFCSCSIKKEEPQKPNIIYVLADDMGYGDVSAPNSKFTTYTWVYEW